MWKIEIAKALTVASAAVCLVSIDFINSDFINEVELPELLRQADQDSGTCIVPVFLRPVMNSALSRSGLLAFQGINAPQDPVAAWTDTKRERCWMRLAELVEKGKGRARNI